MKKKIKKWLERLGVSAYVWQTARYNHPFYYQRKLARDGQPIIFDVGAFDGRSIVEYRKTFPSSIIYSFEPTPDSFRKLKKRHEHSADVHLFNLALSKADGIIDFFINDSDLTNSTLKVSDKGLDVFPQTRNVQEIKVETRTLDSFCAEANISHVSILKLDVQGGELDVLHGAVGLLGKQAISQIYLEVEFFEVYKQQPLFHDVAKFLADFGYHLFSLYNLSHGRDGRLLYGDAIFIPESQT